MFSRRSNASPMGSYWEGEAEYAEADGDGGAAGGDAYSADYRSSLAPSSVSAASPAKRRHVPPEHFDDANLYQGAEQDAQENFKVFIRVRPPLQRELHGYRNFVDVVRISKEVPGAVTLCDAVETEDRDGMPAGTVVYSRQSFTFDFVYGPQATQENVYDRSARPAVLSVLEGYNATLMAYGQTGTGKTYTMEGFTNEEERGIIPRSVEEVFDYIKARRNDGQTKFLVRASYMQIYNEVISDLLVAPGSSGVGMLGKAMAVRHTPQRGVYVDGLSEWIVRSPRDVYGLIERGTAHRATSSTKMSELSSRSHAIFTIVVEVLEGDEAAPLSYRFGKLNIVDLAGSEKVRQSGASGQRLEETKKINRSLHELGNVISALASKSAGNGNSGGGGSRNRHIPFRNSVLTSALRDSLGGNCKTTLIACLSPALESYTESLSTLMFANRAKNIRTTAVVNEDMDRAMLLRKYEKELKYLREQLREQQQQGLAGPGGDISLVSELEEGKQRAEEDREAALAALQQSSQTCAQLEQRIQELETMMNEGGFAGGPHTSEAYATRLQELDRERLIMQEDKVQVDRYKQLLLKQRDIMLNLTTRLNERDETILQLQEEIDAYDAHVELMESQLADLEAEVEGIDHEAPSTARGKAGVNPAGALSPSEAKQYLKQCRVGSSSSSPQYRSDADPSILLTAEEKLLEVLQGKATARRAAASPVPALSPHLRLTEEELGQLRLYAKKRIDMAADSAAAVNAMNLRKEVELLSLRLAASESRAQLYEAYLDLHQRQPPSAADSAGEELKNLVASSAATIHEQYAARVEAVADSVEREQEERRRLAREVDRMRFELEQQQEANQVTPSQKAAISRLWQALQAVEDAVMSPGGVAAASTGAAAATTSAARALKEAMSEKERAWRRLLEEKQQTIDSLRRAGGGGSSSSDGHATEGLSSASLAAKEAEIASLQRELSIQKKDRKALKTILDQRMKGKVDRICDLLGAGSDEGGSGGGGGGGGARSEKLVAEAKSLQTLLNASIKAMDS